jgi:hypothetical protein
MKDAAAYIKKTADNEVANSNSIDESSDMSESEGLSGMEELEEDSRQL